MKPGDKPLGFWAVPPLADLSDDEFDSVVADITQKVVEAISESEVDQEALAPRGEQQ